MVPLVLTHSHLGNDPSNDPRMRSLSYSLVRRTFECPSSTREARQGLCPSPARDGDLGSRSLLRLKLLRLKLLEVSRSTNCAQCATNRWSPGAWSGRRQLCAMHGQSGGVCAEKKSTFLRRVWLRVKNGYPKFNPGKRRCELTSVVPWLFNFDPQPYV